MGLFSFGKKDDAAPRRRGAEAGSNRRSSQSTRVERRSRRPDRSGDAEAMLLDPTLPEKQRARRRLVGAIALVLAAIVILPMVLDSHPKPVTDDIAIDIPSRPADKAAARQHDAEDTQAGVAPDNPAAADTTGASALSAASGSASASSTSATQTADAKKPAAAAQKPAQSTQSAQAQAAQNTHASKPASASSATARSKPAETAQANDDSTSTAGAASGTPSAPPGARFAVQLGAYANATTARNWVTKLKAAGVPAYTEDRKEADGTTRTLLRAGPFPDRASATAAIAKVRGAGLMAGSNANAE